MKRITLYILSVLLVLTLATPVFAHPGRTDSSGGHTDRSTGEYHYHHGYSAHDHWDMDGDGDLDCPYEFKDTTTKNDQPNSSTSKNSNFSSILDAYREDQGNSDISTKMEVETEESTNKEYEENQREGITMDIWSPVIAGLILIGIFLITIGWNDIVDRVQTLRIIRRYLPTAERQDIGVSFWLRIIPLGISIFILFIFFKANLFESISDELYTIDWVSENFYYDGINTAVSFVITFILILLPLHFGKIWVAHRRMNILIEKAKDKHMSLFDYAKSISSETAINHIEEYLDRPQLIRTHIDLYTKSGQISSQCAEVLKAVYFNDMKYFRKLKRQRLIFRILGFSIVLALIFLIIYVYIIMPFV